MSAEKCTAAGAPAQLLADAQAKGLDLNGLFQAATKIVNILLDSSKGAWDKAWAVIAVLISLMPAPPAPPVPPGK